jgi:hypothetical protein
MVDRVVLVTRPVGNRSIRGKFICHQHGFLSHVNRDCPLQVLSGRTWHRKRPDTPAALD